MGENEDNDSREVKKAADGRASCFSQQASAVRKTFIAAVPTYQDERDAARVLFDYLLLAVRFWRLAVRFSPFVTRFSLAQNVRYAAAIIASVRKRVLVFVVFAAAVLASMVREWSAPVGCPRIRVTRGAQQTVRPSRG